MVYGYAESVNYVMLTLTKSRAIAEIAQAKMLRCVGGDGSIFESFSGSTQLCVLPTLHQCIVSVYCIILFRRSAVLSSIL